MRLRRFAPAKINLFLHVGERRPDGYHNLRSLVVFADVGDWLSAERAAELNLAITGPFASNLSAGRDNLVLKAAHALQRWAAERDLATPPVALTLEKNLPLASGIGGGSSDAAATFLMLAQAWALPIGLDELTRLGLELGADVPACLRAAPLMMSGLGDVIQEAPPLPDFALLLANPLVEVPTARVFGELRARTGTGLLPAFRGQSAHDLALWLDHMRNDLEAPATRIAPAITRVLSALTAIDGCMLSRMSGSGATCFGLYEDFTTAQRGAEILAQQHPDWWVRPARRYTAAA